MLILICSDDDNIFACNNTPTLRRRRKRETYQPAYVIIVHFDLEIIPSPLVDCPHPMENSLHAEISTPNNYTINRTLIQHHNNLFKFWT